MERADSSEQFPAGDAPLAPDHVADDASRDAKGCRDGTHRLVAPRDTLARVRPMMATMGITRLANVTGLDRIGVPVVTACRPNARSLAISQGKGAELDAAMASALMEAAELYHAEHIDLPLRLSSAAALGASSPVADTARLARVAGSRFHPDLAMLWIEGTDLLSGGFRWVPYESVRTDFTLPRPPGSGCFDCSSNGLASGNSIAEATCHAICEVIERDATALWNRLDPDARARTRLDPATVDDDRCIGVLGRLEEADFDVAIWETTSDVAVPSFFCLIEDRRDPTSHHGIGAGTHLSPSIGLLRALTEAVQVRTTYISGARDDLQPAEFSQPHRSLRRLAAKRLRQGAAPSRDFAEIGDHSTATFSGDRDLLLSRLAAVGIDQAIVVDLSKPHIGIPVVRAVIPGLEAPDDHDAYREGERARRAARAGR